MAKHPFQAWQDKSGLAAVEFAFVLPVMLSFFLGLFEVCQALTCRADVNNLASTGSDLIAQESTVTGADITNVFGALSAMLFPFDASQASITIYSIIDNGTAAGKVAWSCTRNGSGTGVNGPTSPPAGTTGGTIIAASNTPAGTYGGGGSVILTQVQYKYASAVSSLFVGPVTWTNNFYSKPRRVARIAAPTACA